MHVKDLLSELFERGAHWNLYHTDRGLAFTGFTADLREAARSILAFLCAPLRYTGGDSRGGTSTYEYRWNETTQRVETYQI